VQLVASIEDDGAGLPAEIAAAGYDSDAGKPSFGISGMRERVKQLQGTITFATSAMGGTLVEIVLPLSGGSPE